MCTFSLAPLPTTDGAYSVMINRDESHFRAAAFEPIALRTREVQCIMPIDSEAGGTWIAVNHFGITMALLNYAPGRSPTVLPRGKESRGSVIPSIIHACSMAEAVDVASKYDTTHTSPFRLVMTDGRTCSIMTAPGFGTRAHIMTEHIQRPLLVASSGLGDEIVEPPRRALASQLFDVPAEQWLHSQGQLHQHRWMHAPHLSVYMLRQDARTVSITSVMVTSKQIQVEYRAELGGRFAAPHTLDMDRREANARHRMRTSDYQAPKP